MATPTTTTRGAAIRRAQAKSLDQLRQLDKQGLANVADLYRDGLRQLQERWAMYADSSGFVQLQYLQEMITSIDLVMDAISEAQSELLINSITSAAGYNVNVANAAGHVLDQVASVNAAITQQANDGLQLSERIWRNNIADKKALGDSVRLALVRGDSAHKAAREYAAANMAVPGDVTGDQAQNSLTNLNKTAKSSMLDGDSPALANAKRVFRTEINRAHTLAYIDSTADVGDVVGYKFNLSRNHRKTDICDLHAKANLYGMGRGVYPVKVIRRIFPAHPNTTSYITAVFADEVTEGDKPEHQNRIDWLNQQSKATQDAVLGKQKGEWLRQGKLTERTIGSKVRDLRKWLEK